jgi:hypothetical protein
VIDRQTEPSSTERIESIAMDNIERDFIESLIDRYGVKRLLRVVAVICERKAEHVESNWPDSSLAAQWQSAADATYAFADGLPISNVSS